MCEPFSFACYRSNTGKVFFTGTIVVKPAGRNPVTSWQYSPEAVWDSIIYYTLLKIELCYDKEKCMDGITGAAVSGF